MVEYRTDGERRGGAGRILIAVAVIAVVIVALLFFTGFWSAKVTKEGSFPRLDVSAKGGSMPKVDLDSKKVVVGTKESTIDVPKVKTEKESISVPVIGVKGGDGK